MVDAVRRDYENDEEDLGALYGQSGNVRDDEAPPRAGHNRGVDEDDALEELSLEDIMKEGESSSSSTYTEQSKVDTQRLPKRTHSGRCLRTTVWY